MSHNAYGAKTRRDILVIDARILIAGAGADR